METKRFSLVKPTVQTPYHIDFTWWKEHDSNWKVYLQSYLCAEHQQSLANIDLNQTIDWIDPVTAEIRPVDALQHVLVTHCAQLPSFVDEHTTVVDGIFRMLLANSNKPMTVTEMSEKLGRPADTILRTLSGTQVYKGLRPCVS